MTTTNDALRAARDVIAAIREDDFESFTVGRDPETMEFNEAAIIARYDAALSQIDAALAGEAAADVVERVAGAIELQMIADDNAPCDLARAAIAVVPAPVRTVDNLEDWIVDDVWSVFDRVLSEDEVHVANLAVRYTLFRTRTGIDGKLDEYSDHPEPPTTGAMAAMPAPPPTIQPAEVTDEAVYDGLRFAFRLNGTWPAPEVVHFTLPDLRRLAAHFINVGRQ